MISTTRRWLRRHRTKFAIGIGVIGVGYVAGQYIVNKITEARERMTSDRIAKENLRRQFQQNQEDCTITVLALLPTATDNILEALPVESIAHEIQQQRGRSLGASEGTPSEPASSGTPSVIDGDGKSLSSFQTDSFMHTSQIAASSTGNGESPSRSKKSKPQLWNELKISSITRSFTLIYTLSLLALLTRIQLNLLGRRNYLSNVVSLATQRPRDSGINLENRDDDRTDRCLGNEFETNQKFLAFSWWLLHRGWRDIMGTVEAAVKDAFGPINPREDVSLQRLSSLVVDVRKSVEGVTEEDRKNHEWLPYLLPPRDQEEAILRETGMTAGPASGSEPQSSPSEASLPQVKPPLRRLLDETSDLIDSPRFTHILTLLLDTTFSHLIDEKLRSQAFKLPADLTDPSQPIDPTERVQEVSDSMSENVSNTNVDPSQAKAKLATILAVLTRQAHSIGNGVSNEYVQAMEGVKELEAFAAVIYSSDFEFEAESSRSRDVHAAAVDEVKEARVGAMEG